MRTAPCRALAACLAVALAAAASPGSVRAQAPAAGVSPWVKDPLLEADGFWSRTIALPDDYDGPVTATLIRRPLVRAKPCAVLYLHGYVDYFFQVHLATFFERTLSPGCDFFALDLRKYGRSLPPGHKYPNYARNLNEYYPEITHALDTIRGEGYTWVLLNGHSTGALVAARYLQDGPHKAWVNAAFLNSPFLDFNDRDVSRLGAWVARFLSLFAPHGGGDSPVSRWYARSLLKRSDACQDCHGRWDFDTRLKPLDGFKVFYRWVGAIARAHGDVRKGRIPQPILILHAARSDKGEGTEWRDEFRRADLVLDVEDMKREGPKLGEHVTIRPIEGGVHDLVLSDPDAQARVFDEVAAWLQGLPGGPVTP